MDAEAENSVMDGTNQEFEEIKFVALRITLLAQNILKMKTVSSVLMEHFLWQKHFQLVESS